MLRTAMTAIEGTYMLFVDCRGALRLQMHGAPRSVAVGGLKELTPAGQIVFVSYAAGSHGPCPRGGDESAPSGDEGYR